MLTKSSVVLAAAVASLGVFAAEPWQDEARHRTLSVSVEESVSLEVLDWGGMGRPLVLLAGLGHTAHIFDALAPQLTGVFHVYAITRRGFGASTHSATEYTNGRLADDVIAVMDHLQLKDVVLAGHSFAGQELTTIGIRHPDRIAALIYLDAAADDLTGLEDNPKLQAIMTRLPPPHPASTDLETFSALQNWWTRTYGIAIPGAELHNMYRATPSGGVGQVWASEVAWTAAMQGVIKPAYEGIHAPILAIYAVPKSARDVPPWLRTTGKTRLRAIGEAYAYGVAARKRSFKAVRQARHARIVKLYGADHFLFLSHQSEIVREFRRFVASLR